jgi:hypothetical protein
MEVFCSICHMVAKSTREKQITSSSTSGEKASGPMASNGKKKQPKSKTPKDACFVICPFGGWHDDYHDQIFCTAIKSVGLEPRRADDLFRSSNIVHDIWHFVSSSKVMLADLTGKNPNVFYELGLAHAARKPVLLVTQTMDDVPFDLRSLRVITYDVQDPSWGEQLRENIKSGLKETLQAPERSVLPTFLLETPTDQPTVSRDEHRYLVLQQQIDALRSEMRTTRSRGPSRRSQEIDIGPSEAKLLIAKLVAGGASDEAIVDGVSALGPPVHWVQREIDNVRPRPHRKS